MVTVPFPYSADEILTDAYKRGWNHAADLVSYNVPEMGKEYEGIDTVSEENIKDIHYTLCYLAEENSRQYSPFEFTCSEFNSSKYSKYLWDAFEAGVSDRITNDISEYTYEHEYSEFEDCLSEALASDPRDDFDPTLGQNVVIE